MTFFATFIIAFAIASGLAWAVNWWIAWMIGPDEKKRATPVRSFSSQRERVITAVTVWPGSTSRELAVQMKEDPYMVARRLSDLHAGGWVRQGTKKGRCHTWFPV